MISEADIGIITALPLECTAVLRMLDTYETIPASLADPNRYYRGTVTTALEPPITYQVVVALCSKMGNNGAAMAAKDLIRSFRVRHIILVGIAAGIPVPSSPDRHVRLGDVVVSAGAGVVQYDLTKRRPDGSLEVRSVLPPPSAVLSGAVRDLEVQRLNSDRRPWEAHILRGSDLSIRPPESEDKLFVPIGTKKIRWKQVEHPTDPQRVIGQPKIHTGLIGSGNCLLKDVRERDRLALQLGIAAVEMEGAGVADAAWNQTEVSDYLIIRGICDYADRLKNDKWQHYAATAAAAYMRALIDTQPVPIAHDRASGNMPSSNWPDSNQVGYALERYLKWMRAATRTITVRGLQRTDGSAVTLPVTSTFVPLDAISKVRSTRTEQEMHIDLPQLSLNPIDFSSLSPLRDEKRAQVLDRSSTIPVHMALSMSSDIVITGGPGSGKTTALQYIAYVLADGVLHDNRASVQAHLGLVGEIPIPVLVPLNAFAKHLKDVASSIDPREHTLLRFVEHYILLRQADLGLPADFFSKLLQQGRPCVFLLDGLDEIADEGERIHVSRAIQDFANNPFRCNIIVTSRVHSYRGDTVLPQSFEEFTILPLGPTTVHALIDSFCRSYYGNPAEQSQHFKTLAESVDTLEQGRRFAKSHIDPLISTPLMVRMVITLHLNGRSIPDQRAELYQNYIDGLILATYHPDAAVANRLSTAGGSLYIQRSILARVAFELHKKSEQDRSSLSAEELHQIIAEHLGISATIDEAKKQADRFMDATRQRGGILEENDGEFRFNHPAFEEFLTGRYLAESLRYPDKIAGFLEEDRRITQSWWHEPTVLCIGYVISTSPDTAHELLQRMIDSPNRDDAVTLANLEAVGEACIEWQVGSSIRTQVIHKLSSNLFDIEAAVDTPIHLRSAAGRILGVLGDARASVTAMPPTVVTIPGGVFLMGHAIEQEKVNLPSLQSGVYEMNVGQYAIGQYPVTNHQFGEFLKDGGYTSPRKECWTDAGWEWLVSTGIQHPAYFNDAAWNLANHPVVGLSWFEAIAFCRWLSIVTGRRFSLPTEAEWEKAAKGVGIRGWPWGSEFQCYRANTDECGIGYTTCIGLFPPGQSPFGIHDCAGNVWNWCSSQFRGFGAYTDTDGRETLEGTAPRCIRGGSWLNGKNHARCANRDHYFPADRHFDLGFRIKEQIPST